MVSMMIALSRARVEMRFFAPDRKQMHVIDHNTGKEQEGERSVMAESARICRGDVSALGTLDAA